MCGEPGEAGGPQIIEGRFALLENDSDPKAILLQHRSQGMAGQVPTGYLGNPGCSPR